jgi:thiol-disulfide isomerase/thioredoxin
MKKIMLTFLVCLFCEIAFPQIYWQENLAQAKESSASSGKLIVMDFWATWCRPCVNMDNELWQHPEMLVVSENFIGLKVNVDFNTTTAMQYNVKSIPKVVIALANGDMVWETLGFSNAESYLKILRNLPTNLSSLYDNINQLKQNDKDPVNNFNTGKEFQNIAKTTKLEILSESFIVKSNLYFRKAARLSDDSMFKQKTELYAILNDVYRNNPNRALKNIEKSDFNKDDKEISELLHFVLASCFKAIKDDLNFQKEKDQITNENFLAELNK